MRRNQSGATVVVVISVIATLAIFTGAALDYTFTVGTNVERSNKMESATAIANGCLQQEFMNWRAISRTYATQGPPTSAFANIPLPTQAEFPNIPNFTASSGSGTKFTVSNYAITAVSPQLQPIASGTTTPSTGETATTRTFFYRASAMVSLPDRGPNVTFNASQIFEQQYQNPWDWALFFNDPLEIEPGPPFTIDGWVQTNSSLYTPLATLTFGDKATYGDSWYITPMPGDSHLVSDGDTYGPPSWPSGLPPAQGTPGQPFGLNPSDIFNTADASNNNDGYHELIEMPNPSYPDPLAQQRYFDQAGVKVILNSSGANITTTIYDNSTAASASALGTTIGTVTYNTSNGSSVSTSGTADSNYQKTLFTTMSSALTFNQPIQDERQDGTVTLTELNVGTLTTAINNNTLTNFNQVIYITDQSASASNQRGIELTNGATLPTNGLTIASANPVYIQGDYNTGVNPPSNSGVTTQPTASNYTRQPSSIIADAVDILSNSWTNSESTETEGSRIASNTTVNAAIMSGIVPTANGDYSGGAENFPRFLENWSGFTLTYYGSMVELYSSEQATGIWGQDNVYSPPDRNWHYDSGFQVHPPPGSIMVVSYLKGQWYQQ
jgi:Tfp pilus assembly protein PilE